MVVESRYTDGDYLEDFASFHVRCWRDYERHTKRIHFFDKSFSESDIRTCVMGKRGDKDPVMKRLRKSYCGFIVARPLPTTVIGRTLLKTYPSDKDNRRRNFTVIRSYDANMFGLKLSVQSLPFQQQDTVLAACATVALWSAFHKTSDLFNTSAPRPAAITMLANEEIGRYRPVPSSHGLNLRQMAYAVRAMRLEPEMIDPLPNVPITSLMYSYLRGNIPVILLVRIEKKGLHAITIVGYSRLDVRKHESEVASEERSIPMTGLCIDAFYVHDDRVGPFARLEVKPTTDQNSHVPVQFSGTWIDDDDEKQELEILPDAILIPVYNKIRVRFLDVLKWCDLFSNVLVNSLATIEVRDTPNDLTPSPIMDPKDLDWDIYLTTTNDLKESYRLDAGLDDSARERILFTPLPRFIWRIEVRWRNGKIFDLLADATDISSSFPMFEMIPYDHDVCDTISELVHLDVLKDALLKDLGLKFLTFLQNNFRATQ